MPWRLLQPPTPNQQMKTKKTFRVRKGAVYPWTSPSPQHLKQLKPAPKASLELIPMQLKQKWTLIVPSVKMTEWHISSSLITKGIIAVSFSIIFGIFCHVMKRFFVTISADFARFFWAFLSSCPSKMNFYFKFPPHKIQTKKS